MEDNDKIDKDLEKEHMSAIDPASLVFHYNRENRISKAPSQVQAAYDGTMTKPPKGFFKALVHTKSSRIMLIVMFLVLGFTVANILTGNKKNKGKIDDISFTLSAFSFEDTIYVSLQMKNDSKTLQKSKKITEKERLVQAEFSFFDKEGFSLIDQKYEKTFANNEIFLRTTLSNYDILSIGCLLNIDDQELLLETRVEQK